jgi:hypothetical protein
MWSHREIDHVVAITEDEAPFAVVDCRVEQPPLQRTQQPPAQKVHRQPPRIARSVTEIPALEQPGRGQLETPLLSANPQVQGGGPARSEQDHPQRTVAGRHGHGTSRAEPTAREGMTQLERDVHSVGPLWTVSFA